MEYRYVVLGFRNTDGTLGFGQSTNPLGYLIKNRAGEWTSKTVHAGAQLHWAIAQPDHATAVALRNQLAELGPAAEAIAADQSVDALTIRRLEALAERALPAYLSDGVIERADITEAWALIPAPAIPQVPARPPAVDLDDPFEPLPRRWRPPRPPVPWTWKSNGGEPTPLCIFDLDGTLVDSSMLADAREHARRTRDWGPVRDRLHEVRPFPAWGRVAPHQLPGKLRERGCSVSVISRAPRWYVEHMLEAFDIDCDEYGWSAGANKHRAFSQAHRTFGEPFTWVFGDDASDFRAADALGFVHLGNPWACHTMSAGCAADISWFDAETLLADEDWGALTYLGEHPDPEQARWHRGSLLPVETDCMTLGRYFKRGHDRHKEDLSEAIIRAKEMHTAHPYIEEALAVTIDHLIDRAPDVVVSVPPHPGNHDRFAAYRAQLCSALDASDEVDFYEARPVPDNYKYLPREQKRALRAGRYICRDDLAGLTALVLDDVITTGSTSGALSDALHEAGAARVIQLAWGKTQD
jgi:hypothetical protein